MGKPLRIGLDVAPMLYPYSGVRAYVESLIEAFRKPDSGIELAPISSPGGLTRTAHRLSRLLWDINGTAVAAASADVDLLHMTRFAAPFRFDGPLVVTVHDLIPMQLPEYRSSPQARVQTLLAQRAVARATRVIVPSACVAGVAAELLPIDPSRIDVIPMGVTSPSDDALPAMLSGPYVLHTGGFDARKNLPVLLRAFAQAKRDMGPDWRLVLLGAPHSGNAVVYPPVGPVIAELGLQDQVLLTGRVSEREKNALYRHASIGVNPSSSEGFGLPILEAMAYGVPVIASNRTSHPEVAGDAALLVEPTVEALAAGMVRLANDEALRQELAAKGRARAAEFPWSRTAAATAETYRRALECVS